MGEIETRFCDIPEWTEVGVRTEFERACHKYRGPSFIPCLTVGLPVSSVPGVYDFVNQEINRMSKVLF